MTIIAYISSKKDSTDSDAESKSHHQLDEYSIVETKIRFPMLHTIYTSMKKDIDSNKGKNSLPPVAKDTTTFRKGTFDTTGVLYGNPMVLVEEQSKLLVETTPIYSKNQRPLKIPIHWNKRPPHC